MMSKEAKKNYVEEMKKNFTDNDSVMIAQNLFGKNFRA